MSKEKPGDPACDNKMPEFTQKKTRIQFELKAG